MVRIPQLHRRLHQLVLVAYAAACVGCAAMVAGPALNDAEISANPGRAMGTIQAVSMTRTVVEFKDEQGISHTPATGLLYPTGLGEGQQVWVNYSTQNPDLVKVEGRGWTLAVIPALSVWLVATLVAAGLWWVISWSKRRKAMGA